MNLGNGGGGGGGKNFMKDEAVLEEAFAESALESCPSIPGPTRSGRPWEKPEFLSASLGSLISCLCSFLPHTPKAADERADIDFCPLGQTNALESIWFATTVSTRMWRSKTFARGRRPPTCTPATARPTWSRMTAPHRVAWHVITHHKFWGWQQLELPDVFLCIVFGKEDYFLVDSPSQLGLGRL